MLSKCTNITDLTLVNRDLNGGYDTDCFDQIQNPQESDKYINITTFAPFAKKLRKLSLSWNLCVTTKMLSQCDNITKLRIIVSDMLTGNSIDGKDIKKSTGLLTDNSISHIHNLTLLQIDNNPYIRTCEPFAKSLVELSCCGRICMMGDDGIKSCVNIVRLYANNNKNITTCVPFKDTLTDLSMCGYSGICDSGIAMCTRLERVYATEACTRITMCWKFISTLKYVRIDKESPLCTAIGKYAPKCMIDTEPYRDHYATSGLVDKIDLSKWNINSDYKKYW